MGLPLPAGTYGIDQMHSQLGFAVTHLGISTIRGTFDRYTGALEVSDDLGSTSVTIEAETASINTGNRLRDEHVFGGDWLDVATHPTMSFRSTGVEETGTGYRLTGDLTLKGVTQSIALDVAFNGSNTFPMDGSTHHGFAASGAIRRSAFGVSFGVPGVSDDVVLLLDAQFVGPAAG